uniref:Uncharacterized protein n=1 Tax=Vespula pensylvanica TaxID=30213 RepID=A0A834UE87_VESPE|nr:hypothetical protein H0235_002704 [Vespula pensylvanica]
MPETKCTCPIDSTRADEPNDDGQPSKRDLEKPTQAKMIWIGESIDSKLLTRVPCQYLQSTSNSVIKNQKEIETHQRVVQLKLTSLNP